MRGAFLILVLVASARAGAPKPDATARKVLDGQIAALRDDAAKQRALYTTDAVLLGGASMGTSVAESQSVRFYDTVGSIQVDTVKIDAITAGGAEGVVWFTADATAVMSGASEFGGEY